MIKEFDDKYKKSVKTQKKNWIVDLQAMFTLCDENTKYMVNNLTTTFNGLQFHFRLAKLMNDFPGLSFIGNKYVQPLIPKYDSLESKLNSINVQIQHRATPSQSIPHEVLTEYKNWRTQIVTSEEGGKIGREGRNMKKEHTNLSGRFTREINEINEEMHDFIEAADLVVAKIRDLLSNTNQQSHSSEIKPVVEHFEELIEVFKSRFANAKRQLTIFYQKRLLFLRIMMNSGESFKKSKNVLH